MKTREEVVAYARSLEGTKYHRGAMIPGVAVDCATLVVCVYQWAGLLEEDLEFFASDWWQHTAEEIYLRRMLRHATKVAETICTRSIADAIPGNALLGRVAGGRVVNHGAIITEWPMAVHAVEGGVIEVDVSRDPLWSFRQIFILDPWKGKPC